LNKKTLPHPFKSKKNELISDDLLTIKIGELIAKTEELKELNESLDLLNGNLKKEIKEIKEVKQDLINSDNNLLIANDKLTETNAKFAAVNKEFFHVHEQIKQYHIKQNEFIHIISHELKTPIQSIMGYIELLLLNPEKRSEYGKYIMGNSERLQKLISDILDMSKIDNNALKLDKEQFNLNEAILSTIQDIREQIIFENKKVNIIYNSKDTKEKDVIIEGDKVRIIQVMSNILDNATGLPKKAQSMLI